MKIKHGTIKKIIVVAMTAITSIAVFAVMSKSGEIAAEARFSAWRIQQNFWWREICNSVSNAFPEARHAFASDTFFAAAFAIDSTILASNGVIISRSDLVDEKSAAKILESEFGEIWR